MFLLETAGARTGPGFSQFANTPSLAPERPGEIKGRCPLYHALREPRWAKWLPGSLWLCLSGPRQRRVVSGQAGEERRGESVLCPLG